MKTFALTLALATTLPTALSAQELSGASTHLYSPATNLERSELEMLGSAKRSVDIAMYSFTDKELAVALVDLARSGVKVRVYRDRSEHEREVERSDMNTTGLLVSAGTRCGSKGRGT